MNRKELMLCGKLALIVVYAITLYLASSVLSESFCVFDYGRF